LAEIGRHRAV